MSAGVNIQSINFNKPVQQNVQITFRSQTAPVRDYPQDTVEINGTKKGLSTGAKVGIGLGAIGAIAIAIGLAVKGKTLQAKQLAEHIEFSEAKTIEEAIKWGKENLGISYVEINNLDMLNWVNRGLTDVNNYMKGKAKMPVYVSSVSKGEEYFACATDYIKDLKGHVININKNVVDNIDSVLQERVNDLTEASVIVNEKGLLKLNKFYSRDAVTEEFEKLLNRYKTNVNSFNWNDKMNFYEYMRNIVTIENNIADSPMKSIKKIFESFNLESITFNEKRLTIEDIMKLDTKEQSDVLKAFLRTSENIQFKIRKPEIYEIIHHEVGHVQHQYSAGELFKKMGKLQELERDKISDKTIVEEFLNNKESQQTAARVSTYAMESPAEFVAETFAGLVEGRKFSDEVMALYKKYNGPMP